jgi:hypothetical protein
MRRKIRKRSDTVDVKCIDTLTSPLFFAIYNKMEIRHCALPHRHIYALMHTVNSQDLAATIAAINRPVFIAYL